MSSCDGRCGSRCGILCAGRCYGLRGDHLVCQHFYCARYSSTEIGVVESCVASIPSASPGFSDYRYERHADGHSTITTSGARFLRPTAQDRSDIGVLGDPDSIHKLSRTVLVAGAFLGAAWATQARVTARCRARSHWSLATCGRARPARSAASPRVEERTVMSSSTLSSMD